MADDLIERLRNFEGSDALGNGDFSLLHEAADALEAAREDAERWRALHAMLNTAPPPSVPEQKKLDVGNLSTLTDSEYPGLGDWWVQLWDGDEVFARTFGASPEEARRRAEHIRDALAQQPAAPQQPAGRVHDLAARLVDELDGLVGESDGVSGLNLNGDVATWDELLPGGRFERLSSLDELRAALAAQQGGRADG